MWIARDKDGLLHLFEKKPIKTIYGWYSPTLVSTLPSYILPKVKWEDEEPTALMLVPDRHSLLDALGNILGRYLHDVQIDEVIAEFEDYLNESNYENTTEDSDIAL